MSHAKKKSPDAGLNNNAVEMVSWTFASRRRMQHGLPRKSLPTASEVAFPSRTGATNGASCRRSGWLRRALEYWHSARDNTLGKMPRDTSCGGPVWAPHPFFFPVAILFPPASGRAHSDVGSQTPEPPGRPLRCTRGGGTLPHNLVIWLGGLQEMQPGRTSATATTPVHCSNSGSHI